MGWKDWSYWVRGGMIGLLILPLFVILFLLDIEAPIKILPFLDFIGLVICGGKFCQDIGGAIHFLTIPLSIILIGALIGWLVGKFRKK